MPLRVMHVLNNLGQGGLENGLVNLVNGMDVTRFEHVVCTIRGLGPNAQRLSHDRVQIVSLAAHGAPPRFQLPALARMMRRFRPDVVHSRNWGAIEAVFAARTVRVPGVVHSEHGLEGAADQATPHRRRWMRRGAYQLADRVLAVSDDLRGMHARLTGFQVDRIGVIHNGVDRTRFHPAPHLRLQMRAELGLGEGDFCIGCVANLLPVKDHATLVNAMRGFSDSGPWRLLLIGDGPERPRLEAIVSEDDGLKGRVTFTGSSPRVSDLLQALDVFVLPSLNEGISNSLLEAMATGLPAVATKVGGNVEVIQDGRSGLLFPVRDAAALARHLRRLQYEPELRQRLGAGALQRVRDEFSVDAMIAAYEQVYSSLIPGARIPALSLS